MNFEQANTKFKAPTSSHMQIINLIPQTQTTLQRNSLIAIKNVYFRFFFNP